MKEKILNWLIQAKNVTYVISKKIWHALCHAYGQTKAFFRLIKIYYRAWHINHVTPQTMGDKLRDIAAKIDAIEKYHDKYCDPEKVCRVDTYRAKRIYNKHKNNIKKELLLLLYNY